jgi:DNA-binding MarR family transcriptional regulator
MNINRTALVEDLYRSRISAERTFMLKCLPALVEGNLGPAQLEILFTLSSSELKKLPIKDLVSCTLKSSSAITQLIEGMEKNGLVERSPAKIDRRVVNVSITKKGLDAFAMFHSKLIKSIAEVTKDFTDADIKKIIALNNKIAGL